MNYTINLKNGTECPISLHQADNLTVLSQTPDSSVDIICIDPPYQYLKHKLDRPFDLNAFYTECKRVLCKDGILVVFGRGVSFYQTGSLLYDLGFKFKEEIIWNKRQASSPVSVIGRTHETVAIFALGNGKINRIKVPLTEKYYYQPDMVISQIKRLSTVFKNPTTFENVRNYFENGTKTVTETPNYTSEITCSTKKASDRTVHVATMIKEGVREDSVMEVSREINYLHPTQKPVTLLKRILNLVKPMEKPAHEVLVADYFGGSFSTMVAVHELGMSGVACEIDDEYFAIGRRRIEELLRGEKQSFL